MDGRELIGILGLVLVVAGIVGFVIMYRRYASGGSPANRTRARLDRASLDMPTVRVERQEVAASVAAPSIPEVVSKPTRPGRPERPNLLGRRSAPPAPPVDSPPTPDEPPEVVVDLQPTSDEPLEVSADLQPVPEAPTEAPAELAPTPEEAPEVPAEPAPVPEEPPARPRVSLPRPDDAWARPTVSLPRPDPAPTPLPAITPPPRPVSPPIAAAPTRTSAPRPQPGTPIARYTAIGRKFSPSYPDPVTWGVLRAVMDEAESFFARSVRMRSTDDAALVDEELRRLIIDGYILGRVEKRSESAPLRFGKASDDPDRDALRFIELVVEAAREGWQDGVFTGPIDPEIEAVMSDFVDDAAKGIAEAGAEPADGNTTGIAIAFSRACSLGRETAVIEATFLDSAVMRTADQASMRGASTDRVGRELNYRDGDSLKIAEKALRITRDEFRRPNASLVRNERSI